MLSSMVMCAMEPRTSYLARYMSISRSRPTVNRSISLLTSKFFSQSLLDISLCVVSFQYFIICSASAIFSMPCCKGFFTIEAMKGFMSAFMVSFILLVVSVTGRI